MNVTNNSNSNSQPTTNEEIIGTPFRLVHIPETGWFITMGTARVTQTIYNTKAEALKPLHDKDWNFTCNVIIVLFDQLQTIQKHMLKSKK